MRGLSILPRVGLGLHAWPPGPPEGAARPGFWGWPTAGTWVTSKPVSPPKVESTLGVAHGQVRWKVAWMGPGDVLGPSTAHFQKLTSAKLASGGVLRSLGKPGGRGADGGRDPAGGMAVLPLQECEGSRAWLCACGGCTWPTLGGLTCTYTWSLHVAAGAGDTAGAGGGGAATGPAGDDEGPRLVPAAAAARAGAPAAGPEQGQHRE